MASLTMSLLDVDEYMVDIDHESALLIAELQLQDALDLSANSNSKGKARIDAPPPDQQIALGIQTEELTGWKQTHQDAAMAKSIDRAVQLDGEILQTYVRIEEMEAADRRFAQLLQRGSESPEPDDYRRTFEKPANMKITSSRHTPAPLTSQAGAQGPLGYWFNVTPTFSPSSQGVRRAGPSVDRLKRVPCASCLESFRIGEMLTNECDHHWCNGCLINVMRVYLRDESLHPLRCCQKAFPLKNLLDEVKDQTLLVQFNAKRREYEVPAQDRVYCSRPTCSTFLGSAKPYSTSQSPFGQRSPTTSTCPKCFVATCIGCRKGAHPGDTCKQNEATKQVRALARQAGWQTCPGCSAVIELSLGCYHMVCRCRTEFCYNCAAEWKTCECPQWDEERLLSPVERRDELLRRFPSGMGMTLPAGSALVCEPSGTGAAVPIGGKAQPEVLPQLGLLRAGNIGGNHRCAVHDWVDKEPGGGRCNECHDHSPVSQMCRKCNLLACRRCALNRL